ncbi:MAG: hypothetical protein CSA22_09045 [Deltaproteobacteria bacterium]|nr:MAG: hypothetical protein CSA22_09045 [Deltaproteobacteria bacterium]
MRIHEKQTTAAGLLVNPRQCCIGLAALLTGTLVYVVDRPPTTYFVEKWSLSLYGVVPNLFGVLDRSLASFLHIFAMILLTAGVGVMTRRGYVGVCSFWLTVEVLFEWGQAHGRRVAAFIPSGWDGIPFLESAKSYFVNGSYDPWDMAAFLLGTAAAAYVLIRTGPKGDKGG